MVHMHILKKGLGNKLYRQDYSPVKKFSQSLNAIILWLPW